MEIAEAPDIAARMVTIVAALNFSHINTPKVICFRSRGSTSRARARIWSFPRIWQKALGLSPHYVIEVLSEKFDRLSFDDQTRVIIHELLHIPKNFSGALVPHRTRGKRIDHHTVEHLFAQFKTQRQVLRR